jgi:hypothetical protein
VPAAGDVDDVVELKVDHRSASLSSVSSTVEDAWE